MWVCDLGFVVVVGGGEGEEGRKEGIGGRRAISKKGICCLTGRQAGRQAVNDLEFTGALCLDLFSLCFASLSLFWASPLG